MHRLAVAPLIAGILILAGCAAASVPDLRSQTEPNASIAVNNERAPECARDRLAALSYGESTQAMVATVPTLTGEPPEQSLIGRHQYGVPYLVDYRDGTALVYISAAYFTAQAHEEIVTGIVRDCGQA